MTADIATQSRPAAPQCTRQAPDRALRGAQRGSEPSSGALSLGLVVPGAPLPSWAESRPVGRRLALAVASSQYLATAEARLAACVALHARCPAFLPWPPSLALRPCAAEARARRAEASLATLLSRAEEAVEMVLLLRRIGAVKAGPSADAPDGRSWLRHRAAHHSARLGANGEAERWLAGIAERLDALAAPPEPGPDSVALSLCVERAAPRLLRDRIAAAADALPPPPGDLIASGPWPLFSFSSAMEGT
jgi:hypothetical protein